MAFGEALFARLAEAASNGHDGIIIVFPSEEPCRVPRWAVASAGRAFANRTVLADKAWSWVAA